MSYRRNGMPQSSNGRNFLRTLKVLHYALMAGTAMMGIIPFILKQMDGITPSVLPEEVSTWYMIGAIVTTVGHGASFILGKSLAQKAAQANTLGKKLQGYRTAHILRMALLEAPAMVALIFVITTNSMIFVAIPAISVTIMFTLTPKLDIIASTLRLTDQEFNRIQDDKDIIIGPNAR